MAVMRLGAFANALSGKSGTTVFVQTPGGTLIRDRVVPEDPASNAQQAVRKRLKKASWAWQELDPEIIDRWEDYAQSLAKRDPMSGFMKAPRAMNVFTSLYTKLLTLDIQTPAPENPPANPFFGDDTSVFIEAVSGGIMFQASSPNGQRVTTELLLQPLVSRNRKPYLDKYRTKGFHTFTPESSEAFIETAPGWYAAGYRFVNTETGQSTGIVQLGKILAQSAQTAERARKPAHSRKKKVA